MFVVCWSHFLLCQHKVQRVWTLMLTDKMDQYSRNFVRKTIPRGDHHPSFEYFKDLPLVAVGLGTKRPLWQQNSQIHHQYQNPYSPNSKTPIHPIPKPLFAQFQNPYSANSKTSIHPIPNPFHHPRLLHVTIKCILQLHLIYTLTFKVTNFEEISLVNFVCNFSSVQERYISGPRKFNAQWTGYNFGVINSQ